MNDCRPTCAARRNPNAECVCNELDEMEREQHYGTLYHSNTGDPIGPATIDHLAASLRSDAACQNGHFLIGADGGVIADGSWSGHHSGVRSVYVGGESVSS